MQNTILEYGVVASGLSKDDRLAGINSLLEYFRGSPIINKPSAKAPVNYETASEIKRCFTGWLEKIAAIVESDDAEVDNRIFSLPTDRAMTDDEVAAYCEYFNDTVRLAGHWS